MIEFADALTRCWPVFLEAVRMRRTISYSELAGRAGPPLRVRSIHRQLLTPLSIRCRAAGLPDLPALVVRKSTGTPGIGWYDPLGVDLRDPLTRWSEAVTACYDYRWTSKPDPRLVNP